jgi:xanthine dehydrogenase accessory factor
MADEIGMRVVVIDDRPEFATPQAFPAGAIVELVGYDAASEQLAPLPFGAFGSEACVVVATWGWDEPALAQVLTMDPAPAYVGLVASPTKHRVLRERLAGRGLPPEALALLRSPTGLDLGAETPAEIALSILAEVLLVRRAASGRPLSEVRPIQAPPV